jgi:uncharacterized protein (DUF1778 family)
MAPRTASTKSERLDLRVDPEQKRLLEEAAAATDRSVTAFVLQSASIAAQDVLADRTTFVLPRAEWEAFTAALERPARVDARLAAFLAERSVLDEE